jgi:4-amino-4-deoxy-L-arabinose transferase-like glycosyltransferase
LFFLPVLLVGLFPWCLFLPRAAAFGRQQWIGRLLLCWIGVVFLFFSVSSTKLVTYIYPLYPAAALLIGGCLAGARVRKAGQSSETPAAETTTGGPEPGRPLALIAGVTAVLALLFAVGLVVVARKQYPAALTGAASLSLILLAGSAWGAVAARRGNTPLVPYGAMMTGVAVVLAGLVVPQVAPSVSLRELVIWEQTTHRPLVGYKLHAPGFLFYAGRELPNESEIAGLEARIRQEPGLAVAMSRRAVPLLAAATPQYGWRVIWQRGNRVIVEPTQSGPKPREIGSRGAREAQPAAAGSVT